MLTNWLQEHFKDQENFPFHVILIVFYETETEKCQAEAFFQKLYNENVLNNVRIAPFILTATHKKLASFYEISRTPTILFWYQGMEVGRFNRLPPSNQFQAVLQSLQTL